MDDAGQQSLFSHSRAPTRRLALLLLFAVGCALPRLGASGAVDSGSGAPPGEQTADLSLPANDLATASDLATAIDLASLPDLAPILPSNAGDSCATAPLLPSGVTVPNQDTTPLTDDYDFNATSSAVCHAAFSTIGYDGRDGAYRFVLAAGKTLSVTLTPSNVPTSWDPALGIVTDCSMPGPSCVAGSDQPVGNEQVSYTNTGALPLTLYVIVDSYVPSSYGVYSIRAEVM
jgi:hypothetical protein